MSLTQPQATEAIYQQFIDEYVGSFAYVFDDEPLKPGHSGSFLRIAVRHLGGEQHTLGPVGQRKYRRFGMVMVQAWVPGLDSGRAAGDTEIQAVRDVYEGKTVNGISYTNGRTRELEADGDQSGMLLEVDFEYFEIK